MFNRQPKDKTALDHALDAAFDSLEPHADDYLRQIEAVERLYKLKAEDKPKPISRDTLAIVGGNILGIILIVGHERAHVVTSKALAFVRMAR